MHDGIRRSIGNLLRRLRQERGLSLAGIEELTEKFGTRVSRSRLSALERGDVPVQLDDIQVLGRVYGMALVDLFLEALAARDGGRISEQTSPAELYEQAKHLLDEGRALDGGWVFDEALSRADLEDAEFAAKTLLGASLAYQRAGINRLAIRRIEKALDILDPGCKTRIQLLARYAFLLSEVGSHSRALDQIELATARVKEQRDRSLAAFVAGNRALVLLAAGRDSEALASARESARTYRACGNASMSSRQLVLAARCEMKLGRAVRAIRTARDGVALAADAGQVDSRIWSLIVLAEILFESDQGKEACKIARDASDLLGGTRLEQWKLRTFALLEAIARADNRPRDVRRWRQKRRKLEPLHEAWLWSGRQQEEGRIS